VEASSAVLDDRVADHHTLGERHVHAVLVVAHEDVAGDHGAVTHVNAVTGVRVHDVLGHDAAGAAEDAGALVRRDDVAGDPAPLGIDVDAAAPVAPRADPLDDRIRTVQLDGPASHPTNGAVFYRDAVGARRDADAGTRRSAAHGRPGTHRRARDRIPVQVERDVVRGD